MLSATGPGGGRPALRRARTAARVLACAGAAVALGLLPAAPASADSVRDQQGWVLDLMHIPAAWQVTEGSGVTVAVIDSGVSPHVSDLSDSVITGPDLTGLKTPDYDPDWGEHGTWMASIIAGHGHDFDGDDGITGVAPHAKILSIRVIPDKGDPGYQAYNAEPEQRIQDELAQGIRTAVKRGARVISMSIGYSAPSGVVRDAIQYAYSKGVVLVASSGNSGNNDTQHAKAGGGMAPVSFPAEYPGVISVGAVDSDGAATAFSSGNLSVQVAAPGKAVPAQGRNGLYYTVDGTSPACALVAGVAALIEARYPKISPALVTQALTETTGHSPPGGYGVLTGFGIVHASEALARAGALLGEHPQKSPVASGSHFGGGAAAVPASPVAPRDDVALEVYVAAAIVSLGLAAVGFLGVLRARGRAGARP